MVVACTTRDGTLTLTNCTVSGNSAGGKGGGTVRCRWHGHADRLHGQRQHPPASYGGGLDNHYGTLTLTNCTVSGNSADPVAAA